MNQPSLLFFSDPHIVIPKEYREEILSSLAHPQRIGKKSATRKKTPISQLPTLPPHPKLNRT